MGNFSMLPSDVISDILSRLQIEDVLECKLVSKLWRNVVQRPSFSRLHLNRINGLDSGKLSLMLFSQVSDKKPFCYTEYDEDLNQFTRTKRINLRLPFNSHCIIGSCNGLICFNARLNSKSTTWQWQPAYICNPITREYVLLPRFEGDNELLTGFGYCSLTNEYKAVRICKHPRGDPNYGIIQVYTLGSGIGWRNVGKTDYDVVSFSTHGVFVNGAIHWVNWDDTTIALDLVDEKFRELPSPPCLTPLVAELHVLGDFLCAYYHYADGGKDLWVLKKNIWSKEFSSINFKPITFTKSGGLLCYDSSDKNVYRYSPKASSSRMLVNFANNFYGGVCHKNTFVSLKALGEEGTKSMDSGERESRDQ